MSTYETMLRDIVRDQGAPEHFNANRVKLSDAQMEVALKEYDHVIGEVADEVQESIRMCLRDPRNSFALMHKSNYEAIGAVLVAGCRERITKRVKLDLICAANDIAMQDDLDKLHEGVPA